MRQYKVRTHFDYSICKALGIETTDEWYAHTPNPVCGHEGVSVLWNRGVHTDNRNVTQKVAEKKLKYKVYV